MNGVSVENPVTEFVQPDLIGMSITNAVSAGHVGPWRRLLGAS